MLLWYGFRVGVIGYRDYMDAEQLVQQPFTTDTAKVITFLNSLQGMGGGDIPEDVHGGLKVSSLFYQRPGRIRPISIPDSFAQDYFAQFQFRILLPNLNSGFFCPIPIPDFFAQSQFRILLLRPPWTWSGSSP
jgi:hypothetical protein